MSNSFYLDLLQKEQDFPGYLQWQREQKIPVVPPAWKPFEPVIEDWKERWNEVSDEYVQLPEEVKWLASFTLRRYLLAFSWVLYGEQRNLLYPFCEEWAQKLLSEEFELTFFQAVAADLQLCVHLETVGDRREGFQRFMEVFRERFEQAWQKTFQEATADCPRPRQEGRDWSCWLSNFEGWLQDPEKYQPPTPILNSPFFCMIWDAQLLIQRPYRKKAILGPVKAWVRSWRKHYRVLGLGEAIKNVQIDGEQLVSPYRRSLNLYSPPTQD